MTNLCIKHLIEREIFFDDLKWHHTPDSNAEPYWAAHTHIANIGRIFSIEIKGEYIIKMYPKAKTAQL